MAEQPIRDAIATMLQVGGMVSCPWRTGTDSDDWGASVLLSASRGPEPLRYLMINAPDGSHVFTDHAAAIAAFCDLIFHRGNLAIAQLGVERMGWLERDWDRLTPAEAAALIERYTTEQWHLDYPEFA